MILENRNMPWKRFVAPEIIAAGIGAAGAIAGAGTSAAGQSSLNRATMEFNKEEAEKQRLWSEKMYNAQNTWNYEMWKAENEYNTPAEQKKRLIEAGLNPQFYGLDGNVSTNAQAAAQPLNYERASVGALQNPYAGFGNVAKQIAEIGLIEAQKEKTQAESGAINAKLPFEIDNIRQSIRKAGLESDSQEILNKYLDDMEQAELRVKNITADEAEKRIEKMGAEIDKMDYEKTTMYISWLETQEKILTLAKNRQLTDAQIKELAALTEKANKESEKLGLDINNYDDITVIGTATGTMKLGPITVQQGEPITLAMKKAAAEHAKQLKAESEARKKKNDANDWRANSPYQGPIYD